MSIDQNKILSRLSGNPRGDWNNLLRVIAAFRPYRAQYGLVLLCIIVNTLLGIVSPLLVRAIFDDAIQNRNLQHLIVYTALMFITPVIGGFIRLGQTMLNMKIVQGILRDFRNRLYSHLQNMPLSFFSGTKGGEIQSRFTNDIGSLQGFLGTTTTTVISNFVNIIIVVVAMFYISPTLTLLSLALLPPVLLNNYWLGKRRRALSKDRQDIITALTAFAHESLSLSGVLLTKTFGRQKEALNEFERQAEKVGAIEIRQQRLGNLGFMGLNIFFAIIPALVFFTAGWQLINDVQFFGVAMTSGTLLAIVGLQMRLFEQSTQLLTQPSNIQSSLVVLERIFEYIDLTPEIANKAGAIDLKADRVRGEVSFKDVCFTYRRSTTTTLGQTEKSEQKRHSAGSTLQDISFEITPGQVTALVGPSGAGKTTISYLLPRLYDVDAGAVTIDGHNIKDLTLSSLTACIGIVTQEAFLLHATIRENLLYARPDASEHDMIAAAKAAAIHDRISSLENGYDTIVGERGFKLSGGEKQRIAIARVVLKNPRILILDEATSALDTHSEYLIQNSLNDLMKGRTTLIIAHRLSTVMAANMILVLDKGRIVDRGTHQELLARNGLYSFLYQRQFSGKRSEINLNSLEANRAK